MSETLDLFADLPEMKAGPTLDLCARQIVVASLLYYRHDHSFKVGTALTSQVSVSTALSRLLLLIWVCIEKRGVFIGTSGDNWGHR
jgi:hypothetical protein